MHPAIAVAFGVLIGMAICGGLIVAYYRDPKPKEEAKEIEDDGDMILISISENDAGIVCVETDAEGMEGTNSHAIMQRMLNAVLQKEYRQLTDQETMH